MVRLTFKRLRDRIEKRSMVVLRRNMVRVTRPYSKTLAATYRVRRKYALEESTVTLSSPYFWAGILDEGRKEVRPTRTSFLIWFRNPLRDDPRLRGMWHRSSKGIPRLSNSEFQYWAAQNRLYPKGEGPMIVARVSRQFPGRHFSRMADDDIEREVAKLVKQEVDAFLRETMPPGKMEDLTISF